MMIEIGPNLTAVIAWIIGVKIVQWLMRLFVLGDPK